MDSIDVMENIITTTGFPIFCVIALGWFIYKSYEKISQENKERETKLYEIISNNHEEMMKLEHTNAEFVKVMEIFKNTIEEIKETLTVNLKVIEKEESNED